MELSEFFEKYKRCAVAFSGGVDSAFLLYEAKKNKADVRAYFVSTPFQPEFEKRDALRICGEYDIPVTILERNLTERIMANPSDRCYYCKREIFETIKDAALSDGFDTVLDGTNSSDIEADRPGMRALKELQVLSPLRMCGLTKEMIRERSRISGLFTWKKMSYACLATRIAYGEEITEEKLRKTEKAEDFLFSLGFRDFRVRMMGENAKIEVSKEDLPLIFEHREEILLKLKKLYRKVFLDLEARG